MDDQLAGGCHLDRAGRQVRVAAGMPATPDYQRDLGPRAIDNIVHPDVGGEFQVGEIKVISKIAWLNLPGEELPTTAGIDIDPAGPAAATAVMGTIMILSTRSKAQKGHGQKEIFHFSIPPFVLIF